MPNIISSKSNGTYRKSALLKFNEKTFSLFFHLNFVWRKKPKVFLLLFHFRPTFNKLTGYVLWGQNI